ncbi:MAG: hypothetical protein ACHQEM_13135 [Chitinophagales bacterium]
MRRLTIFWLLLSSMLISYSQQYATTDDGRTVKLNTDGTWQYSTREKINSEDSISHSYSKPQLATTYLKSSKNKFGFWYDKNIWKPAENNSNNYVDFQLDFSKGDAYAIFISEKIEIDLANLKKIVIRNAQAEDPNIIVEKEETRLVNGHKVKYLQMSGMGHGVKFVYQGYYASNDSGTVQFVCVTARNLLKDYEPYFQNLLNGLVSF